MKHTMIQQVMTAPGEIVFREVPVPEITADQVLVKIMRIGICGSDIHVYHGEHPYTSYPVTQGHEVSCKVVRCGGHVKEFKPGDKVTIEPQIFCGKCHPCTHGKYNLCEELKVMGFQDTGTAGEYFAVDVSKVTLLPETVSYDEGALIEPLAVTVHASNRIGDVDGMNIAVIGSGPIGILLMQVLSAKGARVLITDISDYRLKLAKDLGAAYAVNTRSRDYGEVLTECFGPDKADVIYDCAGNDMTMGQAIRYARKGSIIVLVAVFAKQASVDLAMLNDHELDLLTSMMYRHEDYIEAISLVKENKVQLKPLITAHFGFREYLKAYQYIDENREKTMKVVIDVAEED